MADPFVAEIRVFPFNFAPTGWALCNGQLLPISQNTALFSLLGTVYGGDGKSTFALPDMQGSVPLHPGQGPGLSLYDLGQIGGSETVTLLTSEMPFHNHNLMAASGDTAEKNIPTDSALSRSTLNIYSTTLTPLVQMAPQALAPNGGSLPHNNMMPYLTLNFCIALQGVFPPRP
ncbi:microcystin-dependent protein [Sphingomonas naasensis]|uniref:Phage tail protein n=1 Tax=Sphingomonas naasensis TaxID=1344951 RepID=A0A4S1WI62_9SPHN|nr:tail fiber protein [Sphingomonas naasensis]NIJ21938.1 microcystin-dependent protein [Sphingomonas naasensis]TGX42373.1 phage tail protein [Sphingomonas naasensis]